MYKKNLTWIFLILVLFALQCLSEYNCQYEIKWKPTKYLIQIATNINKNNSIFEGEVIINGIILQDTNEILIHSHVNIKEAFYQINEEINQINLGSVITIENGTLLFVVDQVLKKDESIIINIKYNGFIDSNPGIYMSYVDSIETRPVLSTDFQPSSARYVFPCLDLPRFKAIFELKLTRPESMISLSNMELNNTSPPDPKFDNQVWDTFNPTPLMSTYLVSFVICDDYERINLSDKNFAWFPNGNQNKINHIKTWAPKMIETLEIYTGINYTLSKLDHVLIPERKSLGMENWGLINWRYDFVVTEKGVDSEDDWISVLYMAHEIAHQWFGNLVTCRYWCYTWLNEGITSYMMNIIVNELFPETRSIEMFNHDSIRFAIIDEETAPMRLVDQNLCCEIQKYDCDITLTLYNKGVAIMYMVASNLMTDIMFKKGIQLYLKENMFGSVTENELWGAFQKVIDKSILPIGETLMNVMNSWTHNVGFPILQVYRFDNGTVGVKQVNTNEDKEYWWIPLTYTTSKTKDFKNLKVQEWIRPNGELQLLKVNLSQDEWIIINLQQTGYYKINYDLKTWELLTEHLLNGNIDDIHPMNRALLLTDSFKLANDGLLNYSIPLNLVKYVRNDNHYYPYTSAKLSITDLFSSTIGSPAYHKLTKLYPYIFMNFYKQVLSVDYKTDDLPSRLLKLRAIETGCHSNVKHCKNQALEAIGLIMSQKIDKNRINPQLKNKFWCTAIRNGNEDIFNYIKNLFINENDKKDKKIYLNALFCTLNKEFFNGLLHESFNKKDFFKDVKPRILINIISLHYPCELIEYLNIYYDDIVSVQGNSTIIDLLSGVAPELLYDDCKTKFYTLVEQKSIPFEKTNFTNEWYDQFGQEVDNWFEQNKFKFEDNTDEIKTKDNMYINELMSRNFLQNL